MIENTRVKTRIGEYAAEVTIEMIYTDDGWSPYLSLEDAMKLDDVRALAAGVQRK